MSHERHERPTARSSDEGMVVADVHGKASGVGGYIREDGKVVHDMYLTQIKTPAHRPVAEVRTKAAVTGIMAHLDADEVACMVDTSEAGHGVDTGGAFRCPVTREQYGLSLREIHLPASTFAATRDIVRAILQLLQTSREDEHGKGIEGI